MTSEQPSGGTPQDASGPHEVVLRRSPKYSTFMALGAALGIVVALVLTVSQGVDANYTFGQVLGFLLLFCVILGLFVGGVIAIVLDRIVSRHAYTVLVQRVAERTATNEAPVIDGVADAAPAASRPEATAPEATAPAATRTPPESGPAPTSSGDRMTDIATPTRRAEVRR